MLNIKQRGIGMNTIGNIFSILFAILLIYFVLKHDWSKSAFHGSWFPYLLFTVLILYILNFILLAFDINVVAQIQEKDFIQTLLQKLGS